MKSWKCRQCRLVNFGSVEVCGRCGGGAQDTDTSANDEEPENGHRSLLKRACFVLGSVCFLLLFFYISLLETSEAVTSEEKQIVTPAINVIERQGFAREAFLLWRLANYRTSDHWWNRWTGHADAYAATNFPFQIVTLYPDFFKVPIDDIERAAILLHEAQHLCGKGEESAFTRVWRNKAQLGWTKEIYNNTRVWKNVAEFTQHHAPKLFQCGVEGNADCAEG